VMMATGMAPGLSGAHVRETLATADGTDA